MRNARDLAGLFEFEEFEQEFEEDFENESRHAPTLRVAAGDGKRLGAQRKAAESCTSFHEVVLRGGCRGEDGPARKNRPGASSDFFRMLGCLELLRATQERPKSGQERAKSDQERPRANKERPRANKKQPRAAQERPTVAQERPRATKSDPRATQERPRAAQERPGESLFIVFRWIYSDFVNITL